MQNNEQQFWDWFISQKRKYENILGGLEALSEDEVDAAMNEFEEHLHRYNADLWFRMGGNAPFELIITAEGNTAAFPAVGQLVSSAPLIEDWNIIAFIQPRDIADFYYQKDDYELTASDLFFSYALDESEANDYYLETMFYVADDKYIDDDGFKSSIIRIAETALGEYDFARLVGFIDVVSKSAVHPVHTSGLLPIAQITTVANDIKAKIES